jgi:enoyl-CoA hydratase
VDVGIPRVVEGVRFEQIGSLALITLERTKSLNALTIAMRASLAAWFANFSRDPNVYAVAIASGSPRAFSAGSDVREVVSLGQTDLTAARQTFQDEYALNWRLECFSKPTVSLIDGMVMGGGVGISLYGTHRVAGEGYRFAMPETKIGLFPDVGVCHALARMPDQMGVYLGLTGRMIGRADAYALGLVTHCIDQTRFGEIVAGLADTQPVDPLLDDRHVDPGIGEYAALREVIAKCFSAPDVAQIIARLEAEKGALEHWAGETAAELKARSPLSLCVTLRHIQNSADRELRGVLEADYRLACHFLEGHDFYEGVRAAVVDKDNTPKWQPSSVQDVSAAMVDAYTATKSEYSWALPTRAEMQAARA